MTAYEPVERGTRDAATAPPDTRPQGIGPGTVLFVGPVEEPDRYALQGEGTRGGEGVTWPARYVGGLQTPITVAVKLLRRPDGADLGWPTPADQQRWRDHRALLAHLEVPHLVRLHDVFAGPAPHPAGEVVAPGRADCAYLVMEWVDGPTLDAVVRGTPASAQRLLERLTVVQELCQASQALRSRTRSAGNPLLHRDIKPSNCIVHPTRGAVLIDVTTARGLGDGHDPLGLATLQYCAPEVLAAPTLPREYPSEVYALGAVAAFCVLGSDPPHIASPTALLSLERDLRTAAEAADVRDAAGLSREICRALHPDPARRPDDVLAWAAGLLRTATQADPLAVPRDPFGPDGAAPPSAAATRRRRRRPVVALVAGVALAAVVAAAAVVLANRGQDRGGAVAAGTAGAGTAAGTGTGAGAPTGTPGAPTGPTASPPASIGGPSASTASPSGSATSRAPSASPTRATASPSASRRPSASAGPTRAQSSPTTAPGSPAPQASVTVEAVVSGQITDPGQGAQVQQCSIFSGTATLPPSTTLVLVMHNLDNGDSRSYAENVFGWSSPKASWSWRGPQFFAYGADTSVGQRYTVSLAAAPLADVAQQLDSDAFTRATALAGSWTVLDTVTVSRIAGVPAAGCQG